MRKTDKRSKLVSRAKQVVAIKNVAIKNVDDAALVETSVKLAIAALNADANTERKEQRGAPFNPTSPTDKPRLFSMVRVNDVSGVSGAGTVALGAVFPDGTTVLQWQSTVRSIAIYDSFASALFIHGHGGGTGFVFDDDPGYTHILPSIERVAV